MSEKTVRGVLSVPVESKSEQCFELNIVGGNLSALHDTIAEMQDIINQKLTEYIKNAASEQPANKKSKHN